MGSSKKRKDRDHKKKKRRRSSRSRSRSVESKTKEQTRSRSRSPSYRKRDRKQSASPIPKSEVKQETEDIKPKVKVEQDETSREPKNSFAGSSEGRPAQGAGDSLSVDAANAIRAKLGLKPLDVTKKEPNEEKESLKDDVHKPAPNIREVKNTEKIIEKLVEAKEKRRLQEKLRKVKGIADDDSDDDANRWVSKMRQMDDERKKAEERAKLLDQMDAEFGISALVDKELGSTVKAPSYTSRDLRGLKVQHDQSRFTEGVTTILTLADKGVLEEADDVLVNVNIKDMEKVEKNLELKKGGPAYKAYDDGDVDEFGMMKPKDVLSKYDEEITGPKKAESFQLGAGGKYKGEQEKRMHEIKEELNKQRQTLDMPAPTIQSEFLTKEEMDSKFKKRKKKVRKIKASEMLKADDLLPLDDDETKKPETEFPKDKPDWVFSTEMASTWEDAVNKSPEPEEVSGVNLDDEVQNDYQSALALQRKKKQKKLQGPEKIPGSMLAEQVLSSMGREDAMELDDIEQLPLSEDTGVLLTATDEFCRTLGSIPTYGLSGNRLESNEELLDFEKELVEQQKAANQEEEKRGWEEVEIQDERPVDLDGIRASDDAGGVFEEEVILDSGVGSALKLAVGKGYMETSTEKGGGRTVRDTSTLLAKNYSIEDKRHDDIDEKFRKRGRGERYSGPVQDFTEKKHIPEFKLSYTDDHGRELTPKEAFRVLSHKFHGKGSGKKKTEKRLKKIDEEKSMLSMSSTDTPLNTLSRLIEKQAKEKSAYIVLSGGSHKTMTGNSVVK